MGNTDYCDTCGFDKNTNNDLVCEDIDNCDDYCLECGRNCCEDCEKYEQ